MFGALKVFVILVDRRERRLVLDHVLYSAWRIGATGRVDLEPRIGGAHDG